MANELYTTHGYIQHMGVCAPCVCEFIYLCVIVTTHGGEIIYVCVCKCKCSVCVCINDLQLLLSQRKRSSASFVQ